ncbi:cation diffusion facilitator family transporter [Falsirhodobacter sp. alg1]|uniref:cation diffusion facilitator family transporter n=1 Tax=Falsirhodobacter sp. alg1 TaxID=1472418 RepID=UPI0005EDD5E1|nr:cation diffusion facilitator family transporter [Falsirhodobacter sp. alg1]
MPHDHDHDHTHNHAHAPEVGHANERVVLTAALVTAGFMLVELVGGLLSGSLALVADAGHMLTDALALMLAWAGFRFGRRAASQHRSFGNRRFEVLAGFVNAVVLFLLVIWIAYEAVMRLIDPAPVYAGSMATVAFLGLLVNAFVFWLLHRGDTGHVNIRGAMLHVASDFLGSVAALLAAAIIWATGWLAADPILSVLLAAMILRSAWGLLQSSMNILMEGVPEGIDPDQARNCLMDEEGVANIRHLHIWAITSGQNSATLHLSLQAGADPGATVGRIKHRLAHGFGIAHSTVEIDWSGQANGCSLCGDAHGH